MRVVLDSNVLFSALISPAGTSDTIYQAWRTGKFDLITSTEQLEEIKRASRYPKFKSLLQPAKVGTMINHLQRAIVLERVRLDYDNIIINDPNDAFLLGMVISGKADYLVTGDHRAGLHKLKKIGKAQILSPSRFCAKVLARFT